MTFSIEPADVDRFRDLVAKRLGLAFDDARRDEIGALLQARLGAGHHRTAARYLESLANGAREEIRTLADGLTVGETYFFRYREHFRVFEDILAGRLDARAAPDRKLRILSAGAATGEEPYSLAVIAREVLGPGSASEPRIVAVDVSPSAVHKASRACYSSWSLRDTPESTRERYFRAVAGGFELVSPIRAMVSFEERNLLEDDPTFWRPGSFDVVFCRNVLMYLTRDAMRSLIRRVAGALRPGGYLFLGHAETLRGLSPDFHLRHTHDTFYYQRRSDRAETDERPGVAQQTSAGPMAGLPPPPMDAGDVSWVQAIERASARIAGLAQQLPSAAGGVPGEPSPDRAHAKAVRGNVLGLIREERFADAMTALGALPHASQSDPEAQLLAAVLLTNDGRHQAAQEVCERLLRADELSAGAHYLMALCREQAGDTKGAVEHDRAATHLEPAFAMPHLHLGLLARREGDLERARAELAHALTRLPDEDVSRILLYGGGFGREVLIELCQAELRACGGDP